MSATADPESGVSPRGIARLRRDTRGAIFVEFLIAFLPVYVFFMCVIQLGLLFSVRLVVEHAAVNGARAAAVVGGDEPKRYGQNEAINRINRNSERLRAVRNAVLLTLAPLILNGVIQDVTVIFPQPDQVDGPAQTGDIQLAPMGEKTVSKVRVRVEAKAACRLALAGPLACYEFTAFLDPTRKFNLTLPTKLVRAEAIFPYQGARYTYPP